MSLIPFRLGVPIGPTLSRTSCRRRIMTFGCIENKYTMNVSVEAVVSRLARTNMRIDCRSNGMMRTYHDV